MVALSIYKQHYSLQCFLFPLKNTQQYEIHEHQIRSLHKIEMDLCRSTVFCDPKIILPINRDSERSICSYVRQFQKMKSLPFDKFHFLVDVVGYIWLNDAPNIFDYFDISNKIRICKYMDRNTAPTIERIYINCGCIKLKTDLNF